MLSRFVHYFILVLLFACITYPQALNTISADGTTSHNWYVGYDSTAKSALGISQDDSIPYPFTLFDKSAMGTKTYQPGWAGNGWNLIYNDSTGYTLNVDNINVRNVFSAKEMIIEQTKAINGNLLISSSAKIDTAIGNKIKWEDVTGHELSPFKKNDIIMCQIINLAGATYNNAGEVNYNQYLIKRLVLKVDSISGLYSWVSYATGAPSQKGYPKKGDTFVRISGSTIGLYADGLNSPYLMMTDSITNYTGFINNPGKLYIGKLNLLTDNMFGQMSGYGLYADNVYLKGKILIANPQDINASEINNDEGWSSGFVYTSGNTFPSSPLTGDMHATGDNPPQGYYKRTLYRYDGGYWQVVGGNGTMIDASGVYTGTIAAQQIIAGTLTGFTIQTATTGNPRIIMSGSNLSAISGNGEQSVNMEVSSTTAGLSIISDGGDVAMTLNTNQITVTEDPLYINASSVNINSALYASNGLYDNGNRVATQTWVSNNALSSYATMQWVNNNFAAAYHSHSISDITNLQSSLNSKATGSIGSSSQSYKSNSDIQTWYDEGCYLQKVPITINGVTVYVVTDISNI